MADAVSIVLPTFERAAALPTTLADLLAMDGIAELVVVDDASTDETPRVLAAVDDPRLRVVRHPRNRGSAAARNTGAREASGDWVLHADDDDRFPPDYATVLLEEARSHGAAVAGAPWVQLEDEHEDVAAAVARARRTARPPTVDDVGAFPSTTMVTPWVPARALMRRDVFLAVGGFDEGFGGNAYREETDLTARIARAGHRCVVTPRTCSWSQESFGGGNQRARLSYEWWALRNNWRFLRRHEAWLRERGEIRSAARAQVRFAARRGWENASGWTGARIDELRGRA